MQSMYRILQKRFALSVSGVKALLRGAALTTLLDIALMLPAVFIFMFLQDYMPRAAGSGGAPEKSLFIYYVLTGLALMLIMFSIAVLQYRSVFTSIYGESATRRISLGEKLRILPLAFFGQKDLSDLTSTIMADCTELEHTFSHAVPQLFASIITICLVAAGLFFYNWKLALALFWVVPITAAVFMFSKKIMSRGNRSVYLSRRRVTEKIQEGLDCVQEIKSYSGENRYISELGRELDSFERILTRSELATGVLVNGAQSILKLGLASVIIVGAVLLAAGQIDILTYVLFMIVGSRIFNPIDEVFNNLAALFYLDIRISRMNEMDELPVQTGTNVFKPDNYDIVFEHVSFSYEKGRSVLKDLSFTARQGEITALVGPSGGGKSTTAKLAARFWDIDSGRISLGGHDISGIDPEMLLKNFAVVFQDVVLFNTSVMENIRIGRRSASDQEVLRAASLARCDDFVSRMPDGYHTVIGENGGTLSGGERQRISIARALLKDAPVVLLDEATASLDVENETKIQAGISKLVKDKTVLIIAHRMRTIANADRVVVIDNGNVAESGSPAELFRRGGLFSGMLERQMAPVN